jgi:hypothetical protein
MFGQISSGLAWKAVLWLFLKMGVNWLYRLLEAPFSLILSKHQASGKKKTQHMLVPPEPHLSTQNDILQCPHTSAIRYQAHFFGPFRLFLDDQPLGEPWRRTKAKTLLKWFLLNPGKFYSVDQLINLFWADFPPDAPIRNLHVTMHYLRHLLNCSTTPHAQSSFLHRTKHNFYWFELHSSWWADAFEVPHLPENSTSTVSIVRRCLAIAKSSPTLVLAFFYLRAGFHALSPPVRTHLYGCLRAIDSDCYVSTHLQ